MLVNTQAPAYAPLAANHAAALPQAQTQDCECPDRAEITGQVLGGTLGGAGLGYLGMDLGIRLGFEYALSLGAGHPLTEILMLLAAGPAYAMIGAGVLGAAGIIGGVALGSYLGGKVGKWAGGGDS